MAVAEDGARLGKGGGFTDLEFAVAGEAGLVAPRHPVVTTVHEQQVVARGEIPVTDHDVRLDLLVTPDRVVTCTREVAPPRPHRWDELTEEKIAAIPLLRRLRPF